MRKLFDSTRYTYIRVFRPFLDPHKMNIFALAVLKLIMLLTGLASPYLFKILVDEVMLKKQTSWLVWVCLGYALLYLLETALQYAQLYYQNRYTLKFSFDLRLLIWKKIIRFDEQKQNQYQVGDLKNRLDQDVNVCETFVMNQVINYSYFWLFALINGVVLVAINWKLAAFGFIMVPLSFWMIRWLGGGVKRSSEEYRHVWGAYEGWLIRTLGYWKEIKALATERRELIVFTQYWKQLSKLFFRRQMYWYGNRSFIAFKDFFITRMNLYFLGGLLIFDGELTVGSLLVFMKYYELFFSGINNINNLDLELKKDEAALTRVAEMISEVTPERPRYAPPAFTGEIALRGVTYTFGDQMKEGVHDIHLSIARGEKIAIVGRSGSGKSILVKIICGLLIPKKGGVYVDNVPLEEYNPLYLRKQLGIVMQDHNLFNFSLYENMKLARSNATNDEITEACKEAHIHHKIIAWQDGYDTVLGEKGSLLSGGERQRLAIARALLRDTSLLIFDESTSQLDAHSERLITEHIERKTDKTVIVIAHRLSSIENFDRVIVMDNGRIVGDGTHQELMKSNAVYQALFKIDKKPYEERMTLYS